MNQHRFSCFVSRLRLLLPFILVVSGVGVVLPASVHAAVADHYAGHTWRGDGSSYLGSYRLADGTIAYCIDQPQGPPVGIDYGSVSYGVGLTSDPDDQSRLAYLMRNWGGSSDPTTAAAVALNVWRITGLHGQSDTYFAARANEAQDEVLRQADAQMAEAREKGSRDVAVNATLSVSNSLSTFQADLTVNRLTGADGVPAGTHRGQAHLIGGTFAETGTASAQIGNGVSYTVVPDKQATVAVTADVTFDSLPYGGDLGVLFPPDSSRQRLLTVQPAAVSASAHAASGPVPGNLSFQPLVETRTSAAVVPAGSTLSDQVRVRVERTRENPLAEWGQRIAANGELEPIPVRITSMLWGPFDDRPSRSETVPENAPRVCFSGTTVTAPGQYETRACVVEEPGYYVWTESSSEVFASPGGHALPWRGSFGLASETTVVPWTPSIVTRSSHARATPGTCVSDTLVVSGAPDSRALPVTARLRGPFPSAPLEGSELDPSSSEVGNVSIVAYGDGEYVTPCLGVEQEGFYVWTYESPGINDLVQPFSSLTVFRDESFEIRSDEVPALPLMDVIPVVLDEPRHESDEHDLASTGGVPFGEASAIATALGCFATGLTAAVGARRRLRGDRNGRHGGARRETFAQFPC